MLLPMTTQREVQRWYKLIEHEKQLALVDDLVRFKVIPAGRRCLAKGTLVATPAGPKKIETLAVGDIIFGYNNDGSISETTISKTWDNGIAEVVSMGSYNTEYLRATINHKLLACCESYYDKRREHLKAASGYKKREISTIGKRSRVKREYLGDLIRGGKKEVMNTYSLGAMTGDGCSRDNKATTHQYQTSLYISSGNNSIPCRVADEIGGKCTAPKHGNFTYKIYCGLGVVQTIPFYSEWVEGRYAHEKIAIWEEINLWDRESALMYLAGIIDTDGSIYYKTKSKKEGVLCISMQAESVVACCQKIIFKYFQDIPTIGIDDREKYKNGCVYSLKTTSNIQAINIIKALKGKSLKADSFDLSPLKTTSVLPDRISLTHREKAESRAYDITVSNDSNMYVLHHGGIITSNSGKTERFKRFVVDQAMNNDGMPYFAAAPTRDQAKRIFWDDLKLLSFCSLHTKRPSETDLIIFFPNGASISVIGLDKPERIEGVFWAGGGIDEFGDLKENAWGEHISPALDTFNPTMPDYKPWCWLFGVPEGLNHYYDRYQYAITSDDKDWRGYTWKSSEILPPEMIEAAKRQLSKMQFEQEYEAAFKNATGRVYEDYSLDNHTDRVFDPELGDILWTHDQNFTPLSSAIMQRKDDVVYTVDEIVLNSAVAKQSALEFVDRYKNFKRCQVVIYGDNYGHIGEKHGHISDYLEIEQILKKEGFRVRMEVPRSNPSIKDGQNSLRAKICNAKGERSFFVNPSKCRYADKGLASVQLKKGSSFQEEDSEFQHITTAMRYFTHAEFPIQEISTTTTATW